MGKKNYAFFSLFDFVMAIPKAIPKSMVMKPAK